jgi:hypothetical protein
LFLGVNLVVANDRSDRGDKDPREKEKPWFAEKVNENAAEEDFGEDYASNISVLYIFFITTRQQPFNIPIQQIWAVPKHSNYESSLKGSAC